MPEMIVSFVSGSAWTRKVGSSLEKRLSALLMLSCALWLRGTTASEMTGAGTYIEVIETEISGGEGVARGAVDAEERDDVAGGRGFDVLHLVGVHAHEPADLDLAAGARVDDGVALGELALVDAHVGQLPVAAVLELEGQRDQRVVAGSTLSLTSASLSSRLRATFSLWTGFGR